MTEKKDFIDFKVIEVVHDSLADEVHIELIVDNVVYAIELDTARETVNFQKQPR